MPTVQRWGRNESLIWPPRTYLYTLSAFFLSLAATGLFVYVHFQFGFSPLERYYLPYYLRSEMPSLTHHASSYQLLYVSDDKSQARPARRRREFRTDRATHGRAIAARAFCAGEAAGVPLALPRAAAQLPEPDLSRMARTVDL